jgi:hypothetical protein
LLPSSPDLVLTSIVVGVIVMDALAADGAR